MILRDPGTQAMVPNVPPLGDSVPPLPVAPLTFTVADPGGWFVAAGDPGSVSPFFQVVPSSKRADVTPIVSELGRRLVIGRLTQLLNESLFPPRSSIFP